MGIHWHEYEQTLATRAAGEGRVLLVLVSPGWSRVADDWERAVLARPAVALALDEGALCARIDADRSPALARQFDQGAWPSVVLLDGSGQPLLGHAGVDPEALHAGLVAAVARVRGEQPTAAGALPTEAIVAAGGSPTGAAVAAGGPTTGAGVGAAVASGLGDEALSVIQRTLLSDFDPRFGGFGTGQKFPHPEVLDYALMRHVERRDPALSEILTKTLGALVGGGLRDPVEGGFFRCCAERDWSRPHTEKTLDGNAALARLLVGAGLQLARPELLEHGVAALGFVRRALHDPASGLLYAGLAPDDAYYALGRVERLTRSRPKPDARLVTESNARAAMAFARVGVLLDDSALMRFGHEVITALVRSVWRPGKGLVPVRDAGGEHAGDRLVDLAEVSLALLLVTEQSGDGALREPLDDLLDGILARHVTASGDLGDRGPDGRPEITLSNMAAGAQALLRAEGLLGRADCGEAARRALALHAGDYRRHGDAMAAFGRALAMALRPPVRVVLVGAHDDSRLAALRTAACSAAVIERVVVTLDPALDAERIARLGLPERPAPQGYVLRERELLGRSDRADELSVLLARATGRRRAEAPQPLSDGRAPPRAGSR